MVSGSLKIAVLDSRPLDRDGLDFGDLEALGELKVYSDCPNELLLERTQGQNILLTNKVQLKSSFFEQSKNLKLVSVLATGTDNIDLKSARENGVTVCNVPSYSTATTAQTAIALLLESFMQIHKNSSCGKNGAWSDSGSFSHWVHAPVECEGKKLLIVGAGAIGTRVSNIAKALGMEVQFAQLPKRPIKSGRLEWTKALKWADAISLHCPLNLQTKYLMNSESISLMKRSAVLINTGRGALVHEKEVAEALMQNRIAFYATDVLEKEPPARDCPLFQLENCLVTPHIGWASLEARKRLIEVSVSNIRAYLKGEPINVVN